MPYEYSMTLLWRIKLSKSCLVPSDGTNKLRAGRKQTIYSGSNVL